MLRNAKRKENHLGKTKKSIYKYCVRESIGRWGEQIFFFSATNRIGSFLRVDRYAPRGICQTRVMCDTPLDRLKNDHVVFRVDFVIPRDVP